MPELAPDEAVIAVMASSINFNTVWTSIFEPLPTFGFLKRLGKESVWGTRHDQPFHVVGSDASGVVLRVGSAVRNWKPGDKVVVHCNYVDDQDPSAHDDSMLADQPAHLGLRDQLRRPGRPVGGQGQPAHAEAGAPHVGGGGGQRAVQLHQLPHARQQARGRHEAGRRRADLGRHRRPRRLRRAVRAQRRRHAGRRGVVAREGRDAARAMGCEHVIDRKAAGYKFWTDEHTQDESEWRRLGKDIRVLIGRDVDIVFEHPGRQTFGASVFVAARGGTIVTCAATSGYMIEYDNRHLWMKLKRIVSSHFANYAEAWAANQLICEGKIQPILSAVLHPRQRRRGRLPGAPQPARGQDRRAVPGARGGPRHRRSRVPRPGRRGQDHPLPPARRLAPRRPP